MRGKLATIGVLLGISVIVNLIAVAKLMEARRERPVAARDEPAVRTWEEEESTARVSQDLAPILHELQQLRRDVAALKRSGPSPAPDEDEPAAKTELPASIQSDPAVAALLAEQEALRGLWKNLGRLAGLKKSLGDAKHRELSMKTTAEFLGLDANSAAGFESAVGMMLEDVQRINKSLQEAYKSLRYDRADPEGWNRQYRELEARARAERENAHARLTPYLNAGPRHREFRQHLQTWTSYAQGFGGDAEWLDFAAEDE